DVDVAVGVGQRAGDEEASAHRAVRSGTTARLREGASETLAGAGVGGGAPCPSSGMGRGLIEPPGSTTRLAVLIDLADAGRVPLRVASIRILATDVRDALVAGGAQRRARDALVVAHAAAARARAAAGAA